MVSKRIDLLKGTETDPWRLLRFQPLASLVFAPMGDDFIIVGYSEKYLRLTGCFPDQLEGKLLSEVLGSQLQSKLEFLPSLPAALFEVWTTKEEKKLESVRFDLPYPNAEERVERYWSPEIVPVFDEQSEVEYVMYSIREITEMMKSEQKVQRLEKVLEKALKLPQHLVKENSDGLFSLDKEGAFLTANEGLAGLAELPLKDLLNTNGLRFCHPEDQDLVSSHFSISLNGDAHSFEARFISAKARILVLDIQLFPFVVEGKIAVVYGVVRDNTPLGNSENFSAEKDRVLRASASFVSGLLDNDLDISHLQKIFAGIGQTVAVDRMYYFGSHTDPGSGEVLISQKVEWASEYASPQIDNPELQELPASEVYQIMGKLKANQAFIAVLSELAPSPLRNIFIEQQIKAMLIFPIFLRGELYGFIGFDDCREEREWAEEEIVFLQSLAQVFRTSLERRDAKQEIREKDAALKKLNERYTLAVAATRDLVYDWDLVRDEVIRFHHNELELYRQSGDRVSRKEFWWENIHPDDLGKSLSIVEAVLKDPARDYLEINYRFRNSAGEYAQVLDRGTIIRDEEGQAVRLVGAIRDVTMQLQQGVALKEATKRYEMALGASNEVIWDWDIRADKIIRSQAFSKLYGFSGRETETLDFSISVIAERDQVRVMDSLEIALEDPTEEKWQAQYDFIDIDGNIKHIEDRALISRDQDGRAVRMVGSALDVTESRRTFEQIRRQSELFKKIAWDHSHLVRAPLVRIFGLLDFMEVEGIEDNLDSDPWKLIRKSLEELDHIIRDIVETAEEMEGLDNAGKRREKKV